MTEQQQPKESHVRWFGRSEDDPNRLLIIEDDHCRVFLDAEARAELYSVIDATRPHPAPRPPCEECRYQERIDAAERKARTAREELLDKLADPMKALLLAIGVTYKENMKLPIYHTDLGESIQVCFDKYKLLREAIEESLRQEPPAL